MTPYALTAEQRSEPLGLDDTRPRLSWKLGSDRRGAAQTAYRITAAARTTDAYRDLLLRPTPGGKLTWARAEQETAQATVTCGWSLTGDRVTVTVTVPPGRTALPDISTSDPDSVRQNDEPIPAVPSATGATVRLTSGRFTFTATSY